VIRVLRIALAVEVVLAVSVLADPPAGGRLDGRAVVAVLAALAAVVAMSAHQRRAVAR
jgi:hypothetical protein